MRDVSTSLDMTEEQGDNRYAEMRAASRVHERTLIAPQRLPNELELQARWFAGDFGKKFRSLTGEEIEIVQFGTWNREAGPDFSDAAIRINGAEGIRGSIEFDLTDRNWELHKHAINSAFDDTILHVFVYPGDRTFFTRTSSNRNVAQVRVDPSVLPDAFSANVPLARAGRCQAPLKDLPAERVSNVLDAAAQFRLQRKSARLHQIAECHGRDAALFQEIAAALGYKENKLPFTLLAQRLPLASLRANPDDIEAILFGTAGFLESPDLGIYEADTRIYVRTLWDRWWSYRDKMRRLILPKKLWRLSGARPLNHPQRRLAAFALIAQKWPAFLKSLGKSNGTAASAFFLRPRTSLLEFSLHAHLRNRAQGDGAHRRFPRHGNPGQRRLPLSAFRRKRDLERLRKAAIRANKSPSRNRRHPVIRKRSSPRVVPQNSRPSTRPAPNLRRLLLAGQFRLRAMSFSRTNAEMEVARNQKSEVSDQKRSYRSEGLHSHRTSRRHHNHRDLDGPLVSRLPRRAGSSQENAGEKRSHANRHRRECVLYRIRKVSNHSSERHNLWARRKSHKQRNTLQSAPGAGSYPQSTADCLSLAG